MAKLIKGNSAQNIITDGDVIITSPSKMGKTLDEVLIEQQSDIDRLKSNVKYIYAYGGVGGSGSGGSGSNEKPISILITLNGSAVNGTDTIILDGKGNYKLYIKVSNAGGKKLYMGYATNTTVTDNMVTYSLDGDNKYRREINVNLNVNGELNVRIDDDEGNTIGYYSQKYIVESDIFNVSLNYMDKNGISQQYPTGNYECFVNDLTRKDRHIKIDYSIFLTNYTDVEISCEIDGTDGGYYSKSPDTNIILPLEGEGCKFKINDEQIMNDKYMGTYILRAKLSYTIDGKVVDRIRTFSFRIVPSELYISVRTTSDVLYDNINTLIGEIGEGKNTSITTGSSLMMYSKVFEGSINTDDIKSYEVIYKLYNAVTENKEIKYDENGNIVWGDPMNVDIKEYLKEQEESKYGVSVTFPTEGVKKIEIYTTIKKGDSAGTIKVFEKFLYVRAFDSKYKWYDDAYHRCRMDSYFRANQGSETYNLFPPMPNGEGVIGLTTSSNPIRLDGIEEWEGSITSNDICTIISLGIQVSNINEENATIAYIYTPNDTKTPYFTLQTTKLFGSGNNIAIPTETLNKNDNTKYHLIQIVRSYNGSEYEDSLYIDGLLECADQKTHNSSLAIGKILLNNINIYYNLISIQYFDNEYGDIRFNPDSFAYLYWLSYKEKYVNANTDNLRYDEGEKFLSENMSRIFFDGTNVRVDEGIIRDIARHSSLPTVVFKYDCANGSGEYKDIASFMEMMWAGRSNGDSTFGARKIDLYWIPPYTMLDSLDKGLVNIPSNFEDSEGKRIENAFWELDLQGTSTMRNRIKNYSLRIDSNESNSKILFSPNFNIENGRTFLPDVEWTIKADIADSAHANNTSIGKFVNDVCTTIDTNIKNISSNGKKFIKNTLEGFPVLLYFMCTDDTGKVETYYFGIYNFNLGRTSYYNLGYTGGIGNDNQSDFMRVFKNIEKGIESGGESTKYYTDGVFTFAVGDVDLNENIVIGEIQENFPQFDFHQYDRTLLFKSLDDENISTMFGSDSKIITKSTDKESAKNALQSLVESVARAGKYCFEMAGRSGDFRTSREYNEIDGEIYYGDSCEDRYKDGYIPDPAAWQLTYKNGERKWVDNSSIFGRVSETDLRNLIIQYEDEYGNVHKPKLNYTSASEYYTICMAFGMVDSILKNMNLKSFKGLVLNNEEPYFHCAFYDMDCALGEDNAGMESISYLAATDYWYSPIDPQNNVVGSIVRKNDYWDRDNGGDGFDFTSSYLLAVVKYAKPIYNKSDDDVAQSHLQNYPQNFWAKLRQSGGKLENANSFIENYFSSGIMSTFEYLASLNYRVKYLYKGGRLNDSGETIVSPLANVTAFNGSRKIKVKNWLTKRLRFMDFMMNVNGLKIPISQNDGTYIPSPTENDSDLANNLYKNNDITILRSAFGSDNKKAALNQYQSYVDIYAPKHTPFVYKIGGGEANMYLLPAEQGTPNKVRLDVYPKQTLDLYGSGMFTKVEPIEPMFTDSGEIISDNLEEIKYGGLAVAPYNGNFKINAKSLTSIQLNIPNMGGNLIIGDTCISLSQIDISNSGFYGEFDKFPILQKVNISGVVAGKDGTQNITIGGSDFLKNGSIAVSGDDANHKTKINVLKITGVTGNFNWVNTEIRSITITNNTDRNAPGFNTNMLSEFTITKDTRLKSLYLEGFRKVTIRGCNALEELIIDDALEEIYIDLEKGRDEKESSLKEISFGGNQNRTGDNTGTFDFSGYPNLKKVTLINCDHLEYVKLPDANIETEGMYNNPELKWIDTGSMPSFVDIDADGGSDNYITGVDGKKYPIYSKGYKLILLKSGTFQNCPKYNMLRKDWSIGKQVLNQQLYSNLKAYTNIEVNTENLSNTFSMAGSTYESEDNNNTNGVPSKFDMAAAIRFIENCVPDNVKTNITSLSNCFKGRQDIRYTKLLAKGDFLAGKNINCPNLSNYSSLSNISGMYENTNVNFISKFLLSLPYDKNISGNSLQWTSFISGGELEIADDALKNISYRLESFSNFKFNIFKNNGSGYEQAGSSDEKFDIVEFFCPKRDEDNSVIPYYNITSINSLNFARQYINFREMFTLFPNVTSISNFLVNVKFDRYDINGLLKPCTQITSIKNSFCDNDVNDDKGNKIDLFEFFNWENNVREGVVSLFEGESSNDFVNGFRIKKWVTYDNFKKILTAIADIVKQSELKQLTNIFSYCVIKDYIPTDETLPDGITFPYVLESVKNISFLFENCTSDYKPFGDVVDSDYEKGIYKDGVLNIGRSFFEKLPNFTIAQRTFANTHLSSSLTYDYFCKRSKEYKTADILLSADNNDIAILHEYTYKSDIINLKECFYNTKFVNCKNWFDHNSDKNQQFFSNRNYISIDGDETKYSDRGYVYYKYDYNSKSYKKYILDNDVYDDCLDNYTDFIPINKLGESIWFNHDLKQDLLYYGNIVDDTKPFDYDNESSLNTIQQTYCCLPPDLLYGCDSAVNIDNIFANSNIIGVIPRNLTKKIKNRPIPNIFKNVNIMPNLEYYCNSSDINVDGVVGSGLGSILDNITKTDGVTVGDENYCTVVFRDENGILKKRKRVESDKNLGQFVYVPANFTTATNLTDMFNFRYNLPKYWRMPTKPANINVDGYTNTNDFNEAEDNLNLDYRTQYYFTTDKSVKWETLTDARNVFIANNQDIDFSNKHVMGVSRVYCDTSLTSTDNQKNAWVPPADNIPSSSVWFDKKFFNDFHTDLNLCGKKDDFNMIEDYGCPIVIANRDVYLDYFVSGILTIFLNGRVFYDKFYVNELAPHRHKNIESSYIIDYYGFGKNIILPKHNGYSLYGKFNFIPMGSKNIYCDFMIDDLDQQSIQNYKIQFDPDNKNMLNIIEGKTKYTFY